MTVVEQGVERRGVSDADQVRIFEARVEGGAEETTGESRALPTSSVAVTLVSVQRYVFSVHKMVTYPLTYNKNLVKHTWKFTFS